MTNKTIQALYEEFKELFSKPPEKILEAFMPSKYQGWLNMADLFRLLTIVMEDNEKLREALELYAEENNWLEPALGHENVYKQFMLIDSDNGQKAQQTLSETSINREIEL